MDKIPEISVVILCYGSGNFARTFHKRVVDILEKNNLDYEIILVGNYTPGRGDTTPDVVKEIAASARKTKAVIKEKPSTRYGMGWDMRSGLAIATGKTICVIDGDGQAAPEDIPELYRKLTAEKLDLCKAKKVSRNDGFYRKCISFIFNSMMQILFPGIASMDVNGKPKLMTRETLDKLALESNDWFIDPEIMIKARRYHLKVGEVPAVFDKSIECRSSVSFKTNIEYFKNMLWWRIREYQFLFKK